jgi:predicted transcriptional regulator
VKYYFKIYFAFIILLLALQGCTSKNESEDILKKNYQAEIYPRDAADNSVDLSKNNFQKILILLHNKVAPEEIREQLNINEMEYDNSINQLFSEGIIKISTDGRFVPTFMILDKQNEKKLNKLVKEIGTNFAEIVVDRHPLIVEAYKKILGFRNRTIEDNDLFILCSVMLDNWQLKNIETEFLRAEPPMRGKSKHYLALLEKDDSSNYQPFGIYKTTTATKGNERLYIYSKAKEVSFPETVTQSSLTSGRNKDNVLTNQRKYFIINHRENEKLNELSKIISTDLINHLNNQRPQLVKHFLESVYKEETSFREWFFWIYKLIIKEAAASMIERKYIKNNSETAYFILSN